MTLLLKLSRLIDWITERVGKAAFWLVLVMTLISAGNASYRFVFHDSSNGLLEIQWYLFAAVFLLCSPYTLQKNEHVRIDVLSGKLSPRGLAVIDIIGTIFFLLALQGVSELIKRIAFLMGMIDDPNSKAKGPTAEEELAAAIAAAKALEAK